MRRPAYEVRPRRVRHARPRRVIRLTERQVWGALDTASVIATALAVGYILAHVAIAVLYGGHR